MSDRYRVVVLRPNGQVRRGNPRSRQNAINKAKELRIKLKGPANVTVEKIEVEGQRVWPVGAPPPKAPKKAPPAKPWTYGDYDLPEPEEEGAPPTGPISIGKSFGGKEAASVLAALPIGSLFVTYIKGATTKRRFYMTTTTGGARQLTMQKFRPVESLDKIAAKASKGVVIEEGRGLQLSFPVASGRVDDYRAVSKPPKPSKFYDEPSEAGSWWSWAPGKKGEPRAPLPPVPKAQSAGGVMIRDDGQVLLRAPSGAFGGTHWTHAKGRIDKGEDEQVAALREILEETGWHAEVVAKIPGVFHGTTTENTYFVVRPLKLSDEPAVLGEKPGPRPGFRWPDWESVATMWVTPEAAREMLQSSPNATARKRDLQVLDAAVALWHTFQGKGPAPKTNLRGGKVRV